ncbi:Oidioi.mRNA.OKI2018_I69.XSR.g15580.t1.cds [Oikopleura dioica]|uniref:Tetraspanin n=1 Tax=Oikopleura dioica TaxID=34765 RepID=A0ABN7SDU8_OIKDI|nr:Oidioi.mRNA.OKI2018_I69.XSR.g15580.t1.cds [Oikopleura dioica]
MKVGINLLRFFLVAINTVFVLLSGGLFAAAIWSDFSYREYFEIVDVKPVLEFLFATSIAIFLISVAGWAAAYKAHRGLLRIYLALLIVVFAAQLLLSIFALAYKVEILPYLESGMKSAISAWSPPIEMAFEEIQTDFDCCGVDNSTDYKDARIFQNETRKIMEEKNLTLVGEFAVPDSCCVVNEEFCGITNATEANIFTQGCAYTLEDEVSNHVNVFAIVLSTTCLLQLASILFAGCIIHSDQDDEELDPLVSNENPQN